jgi:hypothetical protein
MLTLGGALPDQPKRQLAAGEGESGGTKQWEYKLAKGESSKCGLLANGEHGERRIVGLRKCGICDSSQMATNIRSFLDDANRERYRCRYPLLRSLPLALCDVII